MNEHGTALITGGARRIGRAIALRLADLGFSIALHYNGSREDAERVGDELRRAGARCSLFQCDFDDGDAVLRLIGDVVATCPDLSALVNNASIFERGPLLETDPTLFDRHFRINLRAPFFLTRDFARRRRRGHVINLVDTKINRNADPYFAYTLTKKTLYEFTKMAAVQLGPQVRVNAVGPGLVLPPPGKDESYLAEQARSIPLQRHGDAASVCDAVAFLVKNTFVTGQVIYVDGGAHLL